MSLNKRDSGAILSKNTCYEQRPCASLERCLSAKFSLETLHKSLFLSHFICHAVIIVAAQPSSRTLPFLSKEQNRTVHWCCNCICHKLAARERYKCQVYCSSFCLQGSVQLSKADLGSFCFPMRCDICAVQHSSGL